MGLAEVGWRPPVVQTARLMLRGYEITDAAAIYAYASDEETTRFMAWDRLRHGDEARAFLDGIVAGSYEHARLDYALCRRDDPARVIGGAGVYLDSAEHRTMYLGYILARSHWGQGLVPEAGHALIDHAFRTTDVERIWAPIFAENERSRRAAEKMGLKLDGVLRSALLFRGRRWDQAVYSILRPEWDATREQAVR